MNNRSVFRVMSAAAALLSLLMASCSLGGSADADWKGYPAEESVMIEMELDSESEAFLEAAPAGRSAAVPVNADEQVRIEDRSDDPSGTVENPAGERLRVYNGSAGLIVDELERTRIHIEELAIESGGYVESSYSDYVVIRVPAVSFAGIFDTILEIGRLEYSRVDTVDVTDAYSDIERLLETARETRERLYILLEKSTDPAERARILREIGRLTEEITTLEQQLELMELRISMSRISVQLIPRNPEGVSRDDIPFRWIAALDPLVPAGGKLRARVSLDLGHEWAVFSQDSVFLAENGERSHVAISTIENNPRGNSEFWNRALVHHLSPYYASVTEKSINVGGTPVSGVEMISKDRSPFWYYVGVIPDGKKLHVVEIFSPDGETGFDDIYEALNGGDFR